MDAVTLQDPAIIVERAEALRFWLLGFPLSRRATGPIQRELGSIIEDDGNFVEQHPLAGLTVADFIAELHRPNAGVVGSVRGIWSSDINELRAVIPADTVPPPVPEPMVQPAPLAAPRRPGRPKGSGKGAHRAASAPAHALSVRPLEVRASAPPPALLTAPQAAVDVPNDAEHPTLRQLITLWPSLHPHARRAILLYTSTLLAEAAYEG